MKEAQVSPVAFDFLAAFLDMTEAAAGVALLLVRVAVTSHVTTLATVVAQRLALLAGVLAVSGDVAALPTVVTCCKRGRQPAVSLRHRLHHHHHSCDVSVSSSSSLVYDHHGSKM